MMKLGGNSGVKTIPRMEHLLLASSSKKRAKVLERSRESNKTRMKVPQKYK